MYSQLLQNIVYSARLNIQLAFQSSQALPKLNYSMFQLDYYVTY